MSQNLSCGYRYRDPRAQKFTSGRSRDPPGHCPELDLPHRTSNSAIGTGRGRWDLLPTCNSSQGCGVSFFRFQQWLGVCASWFGGFAIFLAWYFRYAVYYTPSNSTCVLTRKSAFGFGIHAERGIKFTGSSRPRRMQHSWFMLIYRKSLFFGCIKEGHLQIFPSTPGIFQCVFSGKCRWGLFSPVIETVLFAPVAINKRKSSA